MFRAICIGAAALSLPSVAQAGNIAACEIVIMQYIEDEAGGGMDVASFRPATDFLLGVYDEETEISVTVDDKPIRALMCERNDLIPDEDDYAILATGVPFAISQDFDTNESDSLTLYFQDGAFRYKYVSAYPMSEEMQTTLEARLEDFTARDHGLDIEEVEDAADENASETEPGIEESVEEAVEEAVDLETVDNPANALETDDLTGEDTDPSSEDAD
jgi:hypothetical protein